MSAAYADQQLITGAGTYELDVRVRQVSADQLEVSGQVTSSAAVHEPVGHLPVVLREGRALRATATARTDAFGEFSLRTRPGPHCSLALGETRDAPRVAIWEGGDPHGHRTTRL